MGGKFEVKEAHFQSPSLPLKAVSLENALYQRIFSLPGKPNPRARPNLFLPGRE